MTQIPSVTDGLLQGTVAGGAAGLAVGSPAWFAWLADNAARSFSFRSPAGTSTTRKERRQRGGGYCVAYRTAAGRQHKVYLGRAEELTPERLALGLRLEEAQVAVLVERTEGWAAGLQLAGLALRDQSDPAAFLAAFVVARPAGPAGRATPTERPLHHPARRPR